MGKSEPTCQAAHIININTLKHNTQQMSFNMALSFNNKD